MDFSDLDDVLDEGGYMPNFSRNPKNSSAKPLLKNSSNKSIESAVAPSLKEPQPPAPRTNMLQIHKDTRREVTTFQDFFNSQSQKPEQKKEVSRARADKPKDDLNIDAILNEEEEPVIARRNMKPPLAQAKDDSRSVASRRNQDSFSRPGNRWMPREEKQADSTKGRQEASVDGGVPSRKNVTQQEEKVVLPSADTSELKKVLEQQLDAQRKFSEKIMQQEQRLHKQEVERQKKQYEEDLKRNMGLKDIEIKGLKQNYQLKIKSIQQSFADSRQLESASSQLSQGINALRKAEEQFKSKSSQLAEENRVKGQLLQTFQRFSNEKEKHIQDLLRKLEEREADFKEEKHRHIQQLQREKQKNDQFEARLLKRERQLEEKWTKKQKTLIAEFEQKQKKLRQEQSSLRMEKLVLEEERAKSQQEKAEFQTTNRQWQDSRVALLEEIQVQKTKMLTKELQINSHLHELEARQSDLSLKERELEGQHKLISLQRKKWETQKEFKGRSGEEASPIRESLGSTSFEKSLKQLKQEYLRNLGHL